ncbi:FimV/HubP family polar landmark protein [Legionella genomosp. 1]|uniref:FimV/HubP family polar landmark protein n=1 Tax=Legionella genomosp. 1 TaxID=1093625 RepID=UPI0013EF7C0E|nr:FimV/HubP family polar landmark protein [Legionella genomosp. 1]
MKLNRLYAAILTITMPFAVYSLGMGELTVSSYLNQPFQGEIPLIDIDGIPLNGIKASLASVEDFERIGLERKEILSFIQFDVRLNKKGKPVIALTSQERITEPFLQLVVDLAWAEGQLYRSYTILLDPPGYKLVTVVHSDKVIRSKTIKGPGVVDKPVFTHIVELPDAAHQVRKEASYGPTLVNENIWQIAQRYVTTDSSLQQVILAIVGTNSQAFTQGNLNGLKIGERLRIPSNEEVLKIPADLAKKEVEAHDIAWKSGSEIKHVLLPPYIDAVTGSSQFDQKTRQQPGVSTVLPVPAFQQDKSTQPVLFTSLLPKPDTVAQAGAKQTDLKMKAEMDVNSAAIDAVRSENMQLKAQLSALQGDNKQLLQKMQQQNQEFSELKTQISQFITERKGLKAQVNELNDDSNGLPWWGYLLLLTGGISLGIMSGMLISRRRTEKPQCAPVAASLPAKPWSNNLQELKPQLEPVVPEVKEDLSQQVPERPAFAPGTTEQAKEREPEIQDDKERDDILQAELSAQRLDMPKDIPAESVQESIDSQSEREDEPSADEVIDDEEKLSEADYTLEFEPGLHKKLTQENQPETSSSSESDDRSLDFVLDKSDLPPLQETTASEEKKADEPEAAEAVIELSSDEKDFFASMNLDEEKTTTSQPPIAPAAPETANNTKPEEKASELVTSKSALDTLLALAKTYISMDDLQAARQSLQEVIEHGNEEQREQAKKLLAEITD